MRKVYRSRKFHGRRAYGNCLLAAKWGALSPEKGKKVGSQVKSMVPEEKKATQKG